MSARVPALLLALLAACDAPVAPDAGSDAGDAGRTNDAGRDAGPMCSLECATGDRCCRETDGTELCATLRNDPRHCGTCTVDCIETNRGDGCAAMSCTCGDLPMGCNGGRNSFCCPQRAEGSGRYCANLDRDPADCGACNVACDPRVSDRCSGGICVCGDGARRPCAGTTDSMCCSNSAVDSSCTDIMVNVAHCGACNHFCGGAERCLAGTCTLGASCAGGCALSEVCCDGSCCRPDECVGGSCGSPPVDAGTPDAGPFDAGTLDAGPFDAGPFDAGP